MELGAELRAKGVPFRSETDTETLAHLIRNYYDGDLFAAVKRALQDVRGAYAIGVVCKDDPDILVAARNGSPWSSASASTRTSSHPTPPPSSITPARSSISKTAKSANCAATDTRFTTSKATLRKPKSSRSTGTNPTPRRADTHTTCSKRSMNNPT